MDTQTKTPLHERVLSDPENTVLELVALADKHNAERLLRWQRLRRKIRNEWYLNLDMRRPLYSTNYLHTKLETIKAYMALQLPGIEAKTAVGAEFAQILLNHYLKRAGWPDPVAKLMVHEGEVANLGAVKISTSPDGVKLVPIRTEDILIDPAASQVGQARWVIHRILDPETEIQGQGRRDRLESATYEAYIASPDGWTVTALRRGEVKRDPGPLPYRHGELPFAFYFPTDDVTTIYPASTCEVAEPLQDLADALDEQIYRNIRLTANRQRVLASGYGLTKEMLTNRAGETYEVRGNPRDVLYWDQPPPMTGDMFAYRSEVDRRIDDVTGIYDVTQGRRPVGIAAYSAIAILQDASTKRIQMKLGLLAKAAETIGRQALSLICQYAEPYFEIHAGDRIVRVLKRYPQGMADLPEDQKEAWRRDQGVDLVLEDIDQRAEVQVSASNTIPAMRGARAQLAIQLYQMKVLDDQGLLEALDWPGREEILRRKRAMALQEAAVAGQLLGQGGEQGGAPQGQGIQAGLQVPQNLQGEVPPPWGWGQVSAVGGQAPGAG